PVSGTSNGKAVIVCPGGAYAMLAYQKEGQEIAQWLAGQGYNAYVLAYRVPNNRLGALQDVQRAIRAVRSLGATQVGVIGFSAGGSLACRAATNWENPSYELVDKKIDTLSCRPDFAMLIYPAYLDEGENGTLSEDLHVNEQTPPLFVFGTEDDVKYSGPSCKTIMKAMQEAGAPIELHYLTKGGHGYGMRSGAGLIWPLLAEEWLRGLAE
ncbi:MAG: alpha/beta hydrolase, partial [Prevotellaceae bacterium]|nr:alpha/beta hydrolase [Prevotellaceae bacterium]